MKRFHSTIAALFIFTGFLQAQDYLPLLQESNEWSVDVYYNPFEGTPSTATYHVSLGNEVSVNGKIYTQVFSNGAESCLLREENGIVYRYFDSSQEEKVLFDFTLEAGEEFPIDDSAFPEFPWTLSCTSPNLPSWVFDPVLHVSSVEYIEIAGELRKFIIFEEGSWFPYTWIEGIGNFTGFDLMAEMIDITDYSKIACFTTNNETYLLFEATSCDSTMSVTESEITQAVLYPNPITGTSTIRLPDANEAQMFIYNMFGQLVKTMESIDGQFQIHANDFPSGLYFYKIYAADLWQDTAAFIVK